jgi:hypothetical protein
MTHIPLTDPDCPQSVRDQINGTPMLGKQTVQDRKTFTVPDGFEAVRDEEGRATGEVRPTQPTTQAIQQAQDLIEANIVMGEIDDDTAVINTAGLISEVADLFALSVSASEREALEARVMNIDWFSDQHRLSLDHYSPTYGDDDDQSVEWRVTQESGSINDREFDVIGRGPTVADAIAAARAALNGAKRP